MWAMSLHVYGKSGKLLGWTPGWVHIVEVVGQLQGCQGGCAGCVSTVRGSISELCPGPAGLRGLLRQRPLHWGGAGGLA